MMSRSLTLETRYASSKETRLSQRSYDRNMAEGDVKKLVYTLD